MKKALSILLILSLLLSLAVLSPVTAVADDDDENEGTVLSASGECGPTATYTFDSTTGTLVISGTGTICGNKEDESSYEQFVDVPALKTVIINEGITAIGDEYDLYGGFWANENLTSISLPDSLRFVGGQRAVFSFEDTGYAADKSNWDNNIFYADDVLIDGQSASGNVVVKSGTNGIGSAAFYQNNSITSVTLPEGLTFLSNYSIRECENLKSVTIPSTLEKAGEWALAWLPKVESIDLSKTKLTEISTGMLWACENLKTVYFPATITKLGDCALASYCLTDIYFAGTKAQWNRIKVSDENYGYGSYAISTYLKEKTVNIHCSDGTIAAETSAEDTDTEKGAVTSPTPGTDSEDEDGEEMRNLNNCTVKLSKKSFVYNKKAKKPSVTVYNEDGEKLTKGTDYKVSYSKGRKKVGKYTVKVTGIGNYAGTQKLTFTIKPKATKLVSVSRAKKACTVKWKKQKTQTTGYQIQLATNKKFTKNKKTVTVKKNKTTSKKVKNLKKKTTYYVRIRTYKTVKVNGKSKKIYSSWSKAKSVKTK